MTSENVFFFSPKNENERERSRVSWRARGRDSGTPEGPTRSFASDEPEITVVNLQEEV